MTVCFCKPQHGKQVVKVSSDVVCCEMAVNLASCCWHNLLPYSHCGLAATNPWVWPTILWLPGNSG